MSHDEENHIFKLAADFVNNTGRNIFLTGKAGTGKTTFLKHIQATTSKKNVVVAPTGVAAINAGGVTMHSFFQLPLGPFLPVPHKPYSQENGGTDIHSLFRNMRINRNRKRLFQELELLIIDEVSMVRADMLDAVDTILRHFRRQPLSAFGGVQVLLIGDLYQLPPVTGNNEWQLLSPFYNSPFFFDAQVMKQAPPLYLELKKIYRQNEAAFIDVLNRIRNNQTTPEDLRLLNDKLDTNFRPRKEDKYITLCTHNFKADQINKIELDKLAGKPFTYHAELTGDFNDKALPAELELKLKPGAQVMFIKNDKGEDRRFYNGKLATITEISADEIEVKLSGDGELVKLEKETWRNIKYSFNETENEIEEEEVGKFSQYPIRLAWAITIHKSQGLTFKKAIIDAGQSFAAGQVYVALSRCTTLEGMVLYSRILPASIYTDQRVIDFAKREYESNRLEDLLKIEQKSFEASRLKKVFNWNHLVAAMEQWQQQVGRKKIDDSAAAVQLADALLEKANQQQETAIKFQHQLDGIIRNIEEPGNEQLLAGRMNKAVEHFTKTLHDDVIVPLTGHIAAVSKQKKVRQYVKELQSLEELCWHKLQQVWQSAYNGIAFNQGLTEYKKSEKINAAENATMPTRLQTLEQFKAGNSIDTIAINRNFAKSTIEGHLADCIGKGEVEIESILPAGTISALTPLVEEMGTSSLVPIKQEVGDRFTFGEIRMVVNAVRYKNQTETING